MTAVRDEITVFECHLVAGQQLLSAESCRETIENQMHAGCAVGADGRRKASLWRCHGDAMQW